MSIAAISSSFVSAVRASVSTAPVEAVPAARTVSRHSEGGGRRHDLVDAMNQVLGIEGEQSKAQDQAVFRFAHALMHDLRSIDGSAPTVPGRGHAWGRREWSDLPQRIDALATAAGAPASAPAAESAPVTPATPVSPVAPSVPVDSAGAGVIDAAAVQAAVVEAPDVELPAQPNPVTTTSAAVHLMQVPSSRLLEAFAALRRALGEQTDSVAPQTDRASLAAMLERLSDELAVGSPAELPAGSVLNLTA